MSNTKVVNDIGQEPIELSLAEAYAQSPWITGTLIRTQDGVIWYAFQTRKGEQAFRHITDRNGKLLRNVPANIKEIPC